MAKINATKKLVLEEYPSEVRSWLVKLIDPLNRFLEQAYFALVNGLTLRDNLKSQVQELTLFENQTYPVKYSWRLNERPTIVTVGQIYDTSGALVPVYSFSWIYNNGTVEATFNGLTAANEYKVVLVGQV